LSGFSDRCRASSIRLHCVYYFFPVVVIRYETTATARRAFHGSVKSAFFIVYLHVNDRNVCGLLCRSGGAFEMKAIGVKRS
jgi:hypothetical protein